MTQWYEITIKAQKVMESGKEKKVSEKYMFDALSYTEAEARALEEFAQYYTDFSISRINPVKVSEIFFDGESDYWYKCKVNYITLDEKSGKEKKQPVYIYVQASSTRHAEDNLKKGMEGTMSDWNLETVAETKILDVFKYDLAAGATRLSEAKDS